MYGIKFERNRHAPKTKLVGVEERTGKRDGTGGICHSFGQTIPCFIFPLEHIAKTAKVSHLFKQLLIRFCSLCVGIRPTVIQIKQIPPTLPQV